jgi:hypothetical protein
MKYLVILISSISLVGCGPDWSGKFEGKLSQTGTCSDGSSVPASSSAISLTLKDDGDSVTWEAACGATAIADVDGDIANVRQYSCPAQTQTNGTTIATTVTDGKLTLNDNVLQAEFDISLSLSGTTTGTCDVVAEGSLNRLAE